MTKQEELRENLMRPSFMTESLAQPLLPHLRFVDSTSSTGTIIVEEEPSKEALAAAKEMYHEYIIGMKKGSGRYQLAEIIDKYWRIKNAVSNL